MWDDFFSSKFYKFILKENIYTIKEVSLFKTHYLFYMSIMDFIFF